MVHHDASVLECDDGKEHADSGRNGQFQGFRYGVDDPLACPEDAEEQEQDAGDENGPKCDLPGETHSENDAVRKIGIETHAWRHRDGVVGIKTHDEGANRRSQACRHEHRVAVHAGIRKDQRIDKYDVGHGQERRNAGKDFSPYGHAVFRKFKIRIKHSGTPINILP